MNIDDVHDEEEIPWISFSDATIALLFIFIATTFWFMIQLKIAEQNKQAEIQHLKGAQQAGEGFLSDVNLCLEEQETDVHFNTKINKSESSISLFIEPKMHQVVEWFEQGSSSVTVEASEVLSYLRDCISTDVTKVTDRYTVVLTLEGHTDAQGISRNLQERFPSNWELSGARASAALRRLLCLDSSCSPEEINFAKNLHDLMMDREQLQIIAAGRADTQPAWRAICDPSLKVGTITPELDQTVCAILQKDISMAEQNKQTLKAIQDVFDSSITEADVAIRQWANTPQCMYGIERDNPACEDRLRKMRRVDLRIAVKPKLSEIEGLR